MSALFNRDHMDFNETLITQDLFGAQQKDEMCALSHPVIEDLGTCPLIQSGITSYYYRLTIRTLRMKV